MDVEPRRFRIAVEKALYKEGLLVGQWQTMPVPAQDLFQSRLGYGGTGFPWSINEAKGVRYDYDPRRFPVAQALCDSYTILHGIHAPNGRPLMERYVAAFRKVFADLDAALARTEAAGAATAAAAAAEAVVPASTTPAQNTETPA